MGKINTYFDFAENDFLFFEDAYRHGIVGTPIDKKKEGNLCMKSWSAGWNLRLRENM